jgi:hypothetical protein
MAKFVFDVQSQIPMAMAWSAAMAKQLPWAIAKAMTGASKESQAHLKEVMPRHIVNPIGFTLNSTFVRYATPTNLETEVGFKYNAPKGTPAGSYLSPMINGGGRVAKSTERQLQRAGLLMAGQFLVPTGVTPLRLNAYGNLNAGAYTQVLSRLKALGEQGYSGNASGAQRSQAKRGNRDYFLGRPGGLPAGIQARLGKRPKGNPGGKGRPVTSNLPRGFHTVFYITRQPKYRETFPVPMILQTQYTKSFQPLLVKALEAELAYQARKGG